VPGSLSAADRTRRTQRRGHQAFRGPKSGRRYDIVGVLQSGHFWGQVAETMARIPDLTFCRLLRQQCRCLGQGDQFAWHRRLHSRFIFRTWRRQYAQRPIAARFVGDDDRRGLGPDAIIIHLKCALRSRGRLPQVLREALPNGADQKNDDGEDGQPSSTSMLLMAASTMGVAEVAGHFVSDASTALSRHRMAMPAESSRWPRQPAIAFRRLSGDDALHLDRVSGRLPPGSFHARRMMATEGMGQ
jgi:hypothetical protein